MQMIIKYKHKIFLELFVLLTLLFVLLLNCLNYFAYFPLDITVVISNTQRLDENEPYKRMELTKWYYTSAPMYIPWLK